MTPGSIKIQTQASATSSNTLKNMLQESKVDKRQGLPRNPF